jgi:hypothetical protein
VFVGVAKYPLLVGTLAPTSLSFSSYYLVECHIETCFVYVKDSEIGKSVCLISSEYRQM